MQAEHVADALKLTPTVLFTSTSIAGVRYDTISYVLASIYTALMIGNFIWTKMIKPWRMAQPDPTDQAGA
jgi:hypothetical protein